MNSENKKKIEVIATAALLAALGISVLYSKSGITRKFLSFPAREVGALNLDAAKERLTRDMQAGTDEYKGEALRDPLKKPPEIVELERQAPITGPAKEAKPAEEKKSEYALQGLLLGGKQKLAIISGNTVAEGERVEGAEVLSIGPGGVTLLKDGTKIELKR